MTLLTMFTTTKRATLCYMSLYSAILSQRRIICGMLKMSQLLNALMSLKCVDNDQKRAPLKEESCG